MQYSRSELERRGELALALRYSGGNGLDRALLDFGNGLSPQPKPTADGRHGPPRADVLIITATEAETAAVGELFTPNWRRHWHPYAQHYASFVTDLAALSPARQLYRLGSFLLSQVGKLRVLCFKSELALHSDAEPGDDSYFAPPVVSMLKLLIEEVQPRFVLSVGAGCGVYADISLGDVIISRAAKFACQRVFVGARFDDNIYQSLWTVPRYHFARAEMMMHQIAAQLAWQGEPPSLDCPCQQNVLRPGGGMILQDGASMPDFHPFLTTDYFEFATDASHLYRQGAIIDLDTAAVALACSECAEPPRWAGVRGIAVPVLNGDLPMQLQENCAAWYQSTYGFWASANAALTSWAIIAGLQ